ncbi:MAG: cupin domain-containing protein [Gammaproteobacteria bacterium]|nr:cupin domain-containing protein [Gammaproteobacteria bacterium]MCP5199498.1 cupin domain-containing protein [Gammaproteobacteria bacterium]
MERMTTAAALAALAGDEGARYKALFGHGSLEVGVYRPPGIDPQQPHTRDELYVVIAGRGQFVNGDTRRPFEPGEVLFVAAGVEHRFEDFTPDFAAWVFFYGPAGGECPA